MHYQSRERLEGCRRLGNLFRHPEGRHAGGFRRGCAKNTEGNWTGTLAGMVSRQRASQHRPPAQGTWRLQPNQCFGLLGEGGRRRGDNRHHIAGGSTCAWLSVLVQCAPRELALRSDFSNATQGNAPENDPQEEPKYTFIACLVDYVTVNMNETLFWGGCSSTPLQAFS